MRLKKVTRSGVEEDRLVYGDPSKPISLIKPDTVEEAIKIMQKYNMIPVNSIADNRTSLLVPHPDPDEKPMFLHIGDQILIDNELPVWTIVDIHTAGLIDVEIESKEGNFGRTINPSNEEIEIVNSKYSQS